MYNLKQSLLECGYSGPCTNLSLLKWAVRAGASSQFFIDLISWLECQLKSIISTEQVSDNIRRLFSMMRLSILMKPSYGSDAAINPKEFRIQTLKVLTKQLQLRKLPERTQYVDEDYYYSQKNTVSVCYQHLTVTLNTNKNQRLVQL